ncbi:hypothetical protein D9756_005504 [Leucocoprinus leucothites]|uniref:HAT C-terminal dimerisation domain-containing protein n=1 Tax=Leucocoprinus leucothites TaxID=201217 RepID=A0A8H5FZB4_9AGAR|nr:hypothetical protein D9756_005504 [Leucoagaricus leucothites]
MPAPSIEPGICDVLANMEESDDDKEEDGRDEDKGDDTDDNMSSVQIDGGPRKKKVQDVWEFFLKEGSERVEAKRAEPEYEVMTYALSTGTTILYCHLTTIHLATWAQSLRRLKLKVGGREAQALVDNYWMQQDEANSYHPISSGDTLDRDSRVQFTKEAFYDALQEFIITTNSFLIKLKSDIKGAPGKVSLTTDMWTDENLSPFMAITTHRIEALEINTPAGPRCLLTMKSYVIGFHRVSGHHTGNHLAQALRFIVDHINLTSKTCNNDILRCFPHIVNLACQTLLKEVTNICLAEVNSPDYNPNNNPAQSRDAIAILHTVIHTAITEYLMLNTDAFRVTLLRSNWDTLEVYVKILVVLSAEKVPTLCEVLPSFNAMIVAWCKQQLKFPAYSMVIEAGLSKLSDYQDRIVDIPAYSLTILINPSMKLDWFKENMPTEIEQVQDLFIKHENHWRYPTIFCLALDILSIQASSVSCERLFSIAKETMTLHCNRIGPDLMEALQMLKYAYDHGGEELNFTTGMSKDDEVEFLINLDSEQTSVPEDISLFIDTLHNADSSANL